MPRKSYKGKFQPKNPSKYKGNISEIVYRSLLERTFMVYCDTNPSIIEWSSETIIVPYFDPVKGKNRRYFVDFYILYRDTNDNIRKSLIEVKPEKQTKEPTKRKNARKSQKYITEVCTYLTNQAKWNAARKWCENNGADFRILTEKHLRYKK